MINFYTFIGVCYVAFKLVDFFAWLDQPRKR